MTDHLTLESLRVAKLTGGSEGTYQLDRPAIISDLIEVLESEGAERVTLHAPIIAPDRFDPKEDVVLAAGTYLVLRIEEGS